MVTLHGEIDLLTAPAVTARLDRLTAGRRPDVVIDLRTVDFIDCSGLGALCRARRRALARRGRLRLVCDSPRFLQILRYVRLEGDFDIRPRLVDALGA